MHTNKPLYGLALHVHQLKEQIGWYVPVGLRLVMEFVHVVDR